MTKHKKQKTAAIYDRWLFTLGGGEQVAFAYAETLRELGYKTDLLTHKTLDVEQAERKMDVSLENIDLRYLPQASSEELSGYSEEYDVFINTSYLDYFANRADTGLLSVFFPGQIFLTPYEYIKRAFLLPSIKSFFIYPTRYEGFTHDTFQRGKIHKWLGKTSQILFNEPVSSFQIELSMQTVAFSLVDSITFSIDDRPIKPAAKQLNHHHNLVTYKFEIPASESFTKFEIQLPENIDYTQQVALTRLTIPNIRYMLYNVFKRYFPKYEMRLHGGPGVTKRSDLESYHEIITISDFCKKWIRKYWGLDSTVLYPPVNTENFAPAKKKKKRIMHIGRFFVTGHSKKQLEMVQLFKTLVDKHGVKDWELHFIGSVHEGTKHQQYFQQVQAAARDYPIYFHINIPFTELKKLLAEASIYWHATGLDESPEKNPIVFEHFGVTTIEAMASGCVPIVINQGGQSEIVTQDSGFRWNNRQEWIEQTLQMINHPKERRKIAKETIKRAEHFSRKNFKRRFAKILELNQVKTN